MSASSIRITLNTSPAVLDTDLSFDPAEALQELSNWPGYRVSPLIRADHLAAELGVEQVWYKHEGERFGTGSFKPMGAGYAVSRVVARHVEDATGRPRVTSAQLLSGPFADVTADVTVACATDGNHGRAVAWAAQLFGCRAVVYVANHVSEFRCDAIRAYGAEVVQTSGGHDAAVERVAKDATRHGWHVVSETARASRPEIAYDIFAGYGALMLEARNQMDGIPTHVMVPVGVGGLATGCIAALRADTDSADVKVVAVESVVCDSVRRSLASGTRETVAGDFHTIMAGLAAGAISEYAWPVLQAGLFAGVGIPDDGVSAAVNTLAEREGIEAGETGVAGLVALMAMTEDAEAREQLELTAASRVLVIGTEGVTDPAVFQQLTGRSPEAE